MWKRIAVGALLVAGGCASSNKIRANADLHVARAQARAANGDTVGAEKEMDKAHKQYNKAEAREYYERYYRM